MDKTFIGCDPDTKRPSFAAVSEKGEVVWLWCPKITSPSDIAANFYFERGMENVTYAAVEGQYVARGGANKAAGLIKLAQVAGACLATLQDIIPLYENPERIKIISPVKWKGSIPKPIHQARILTKLGWGFKSSSTYSSPVNPPKQYSKIKKGEWKHLVDAIGIALWAKELYEKEQRTGMSLWKNL